MYCLDMESHFPPILSSFAIYFHINANCNVSTNTSSDNINIYRDNLSVVIVSSE